MRYYIINTKNSSIQTFNGDGDLDAIGINPGAVATYLNKDTIKKERPDLGCTSSRMAAFFNT